jgi:ubiquitin-like protein Pup
MAQRESAESRRRQQEETEVDEQPLPQGNDADLDSDVDSILDEIDEVLEENAEDFVKSFVQKGGQ